ncbi:CMGC/MAPK protein kinase [Coprinopsis cinerea AmutBmut pab1-1]|nr:CMGC/MAPK protein kinase [Coprinopsis cinerea AmutBmut pab1-1]
MDIVEQANAERQRKWLKDRKVGEGAYAVVYQGREASTGRKVAIKKIKVGQFKDGLDMSAIREVKFLRELKHQNVIEVWIYTSCVMHTAIQKAFSLASRRILFEKESQPRPRILGHRPGDYHQRQVARLPPSRHQIVDGHDVQRARVLPQELDLAPGLETQQLAHRFRWSTQDRRFRPGKGLCRPRVQDDMSGYHSVRPCLSSPGPLYLSCSSRWYRPPELLYGCRYYGTGVDIWSVGCIFAELMLRIPYLAGESDMDQLKTIFRALGTPTEEEWPGHTKLPDYVPVGQFPKTPLRDLFTAASADALNLLSKCLVYEPRKRISAREALNHPYFFALPYPTHPSKLPKPASKHATPPLGEVDGNAAGGKKRKGTKRKLSSPLEDGKGRSIARRLDFGKAAPPTSP